MKDTVKHISESLAVTKNAVYVFDTAGSKAMNKISAAMQKTTSVPPDNDNTDSKDTQIGLQNWGDDNNYPLENWEKITTSSLPLRMFEDLTRLHFGNGLYYFTNKIVDGKKVRLEAIDEKVDEWMRKNKIQFQYSNYIIRDYVIWKDCPVEVVIDRTNKQIVKAKAQDMVYCRWGDKNEKGIVDKCFLSAKFPYNYTKDIKELPVIDPLNVEESIKKAGKNVTNFIYPVKELTPGHMYYPQCYWASDNSMNWIEVSCLTPVFYKALMQNILTITMVVYIHNDFWSQRYHDWEEKKDLQTKRKEDTIKSIEDSLAGSEKAGKFIAAGYYFDEEGNEVKGIKIESIENKINDKAFLMTTATANLELAMAWGYDPSLMGQGIPGGKELSGSGSDKMRGLQNKQIMLACDRAVTLDFMNFVSAYNGWKYEWDYLDRIPTTLDENKDGLKSKKEEDVN